MKLLHWEDFYEDTPGLRRYVLGGLRGKPVEILYAALAEIEYITQCRNLNNNSLVTLDKKYYGFVLTVEKSWLTLIAGWIRAEIK